MIQRRDRGSEVVVAVLAVGVIAVALTFGIVLDLGNRSDESDAEATAFDTQVVQDVVVDDVRPTLVPTEIAQDEPTVTLTATVADTEVIATETLTLTPTEPTVTPSDTSTDLPTDFPSATVTTTQESQPEATATVILTDTPTDEPTNTPTITVSFTNTATATPTATSTDTPTLTPTVTPSNTSTFTPSATNTASPTATVTPSFTPTATPTPTQTPSMTLTQFPTLTITPFVLPPTVIACEPNPDWEPYVVQSGDILFEIALASGLRTDVVRQANCLETSNIVAGQTLLVPPDSPLLQTAVQQPATAPNCNNPAIQISYPRGGDVLDTAFVARGIADDEFFGYYAIRVLPNPETIFTVYESNARVSMNNVIGTVNVPAFPAGNYTLRLIVFNQWGDAVDYCDVAVVFNP